MILLFRLFKALTIIMVVMAEQVKMLLVTIIIMYLLLSLLLNSHSVNWGITLLLMSHY